MHKLIEQELKDNAALIKRLIALEGPVQDIDDYLKGRPEISGYVEVHMGFGVSVSVTIHVDSMRQVAPVLRALAKASAHQHKGSKPSSNEYGRNYQLRVGSALSIEKGEPVTEPLTLYVMLNNPKTNPSCKYVKVREKTVDVFEWQCDGKVVSETEVDQPEQVAVAEASAI